MIIKEGAMIGQVFIKPQNGLKSLCITAHLVQVILNTILNLGSSLSLYKTVVRWQDN